MRWAIRLLFGTKRGWRQLALHSLAAFGLISAAIQLYAAVAVPAHGVAKPGLFVVVVAAACFAYGVARAWPRRTVRREFGRPELAITVTVGDILDQKGQIVVGFTDMFDTSVSDGVINPRSLQGQLLDRVYAGDVKKLDDALDAALAGIKPKKVEQANEKKHGKLARYPIGTVAVVSTDANTIYAVAYSSMSNDLVSKSSVHDLWYSLGQLWDAVYKHGQRAPVMMPIVGSELARINCLDRENLLKMVLLSFMSRSREELICKEFTVFVHRKDQDKINMLEIEAFLKSL